MKYPLLASVLLASAIAHPASNAKAKRFSIISEDDSTQGKSDASVLSYALTLEHVEDAFYRGGLANFTQTQFADAGFDATFYSNLQKVASDEATHVQVLSSALAAAGVPVPQECLYSFPYTDPASFVALASVLEGVGVGAYTGASVDIISPDYLTAAASILTIEARHASYIRSQIGEEPFPAPFDTALDYNQVYSLAAGFFVSCPSTNPPLGLTKFPALGVSPAGVTQSGAAITLETFGYVLANTDPSGDAQLYGAFLAPTGPIFQPATKVAGGYTVTVPAGINGQSYVVLTMCNDKVTDDTTLAGPALVEVVNPMIQAQPKL